MQSTNNEAAAIKEIAERRGDDEVSLDLNAPALSGPNLAQTILDLIASDARSESVERLGECALHALADDLDVLWSAVESGNLEGMTVANHVYRLMTRARAAAGLCERIREANASGPETVAWRGMKPAPHLVPAPREAARERERRPKRR